MREHDEESAQRGRSRAVPWWYGISGSFHYAGAPISTLAPQGDTGEIRNWRFLTAVGIFDGEIGARSTGFFLLGLQRKTVLG